MSADSRHKGSPHIQKWGRINESKMSRWLGHDEVDSMKFGSYGIKIPIPIFGAPAFAYDGEIIPRYAGGAGFTDYADVLAERLAKSQYFMYSKVGTGNALQNLCGNLSGRTGVPDFIVDSPSLASGGSARNNTTKGAFNFTSPGGTDKAFLGGWTYNSTVASTLMLVDYLWGATSDHATTSHTTTGVPTRYTGTDSAGNFITGRVNVALGAGAQNVTITYQDQDGNTAEAGAATAIRASSALETTPFTTPQWMYPLNSGDIGVRKITALSFDVASTGTTDWTINHPLAFMSSPRPGHVLALDGITSAFNMVEIKSSACLSFVHMFPSAAGAVTFYGILEIMAG